MKEIFDKLTYQFFIGQMLPGAVVIFSVKIFLCIQSINNNCNQPYSAGSGLLQMYITSFNKITSMHEILGLIVLSILAGMILQGINFALIANRESFRKIKLDNTSCWVDKKDSEIRKRSFLRNKIADLFSHKKALVIILLSPLILLFDLVSMLVAPIQSLYKEVCWGRVGKEKVEVLKLIITDYEHLASYSLNMAVALVVSSPLNLYLIIKLGHYPMNIAYAFFLYFIISGHYFLSRILCTTIDRAIYLTFSKETSGPGKEEIIVNKEPVHGDRFGSSGLSDLNMDRK